MTFALVVGTTETASIDGISAAGADPEAMRYTPAADAEIVTYGEPVFAPDVPVSPTGCPTPAVVTRAVRELLEFETVVVDAGVPGEVAAPTVSAGASPGGDVRAETPVPDAAEIFERARRLGRELPTDELVVGESIPGGTTTALGVLTALGASHDVSSSLPENPLSLKRRVVETGLAESGVAPGDLSHRPLEALRLMGDPVLATVAGLATGALDADASVTLAGGTQMLAAAGVVRHAGIADPLSVATTSFVAEDDTADVRAAADDFAADLVVSDPGFERSDHVAMERFRAGEAKEGVGMGGALALADRGDVSPRAIRDRIVERYEALIEHEA